MFIDDNSSYGEGIMDNFGNIHIAHNHQYSGNESKILYQYSKDSGTPFSNPISLYSMSNNSNNMFGEYQSLLLLNDNLFHLSFIDIGDYFKAKELVFNPFTKNYLIFHYLITYMILLNSNNIYN